MEEEWRDIPGYEGYYKVSSFGNVKSVDRFVNSQWGNHFPVKGKTKATCTDKYGYLHVCLSKEGKKWYPTIHRLVALAFINNPENKPCVDHIDGDRTNNSAMNLRWCTVLENNRNPVTIKRHKEKVFTEERNKNVSKGLKGHYVSPETRKKISEAKKLYHQRLKNNGRNTSSQATDSKAVANQSL